MTTFAQGLDGLWFPESHPSRLEALMSSFPGKISKHARQQPLAKEVKISRIAHQEEQYERELLNIRNFGYHWLKPIGVAKTMSQIQDEARETQESFDEFEDEDGEFNQNNPNLPAGLEGQDVMSEEGPEHDAGQEEEEEEEDLDEQIEEGASFDVNDTSYVSSTGPVTPGMHSGGLRDVINGTDREGSFHTSSSASTPRDDGDDVVQEEGMESAEEGSLGEYSSEAEESGSEDA